MLHPAYTKETTHPHKMTPTGATPGIASKGAAITVTTHMGGKRKTSTVSGRSSSKDEPFSRAPSRTRHRCSNATRGRPPPGTKPSCPQNTRQRRGRRRPGCVDPRQAWPRETRHSSNHPKTPQLCQTSVEEPHVECSKAASSRRTRHQSAATARSEDLGIHPEHEGDRENTATTPSTRERRPETPLPWPKGQGFPSAKTLPPTRGMDRRKTAPTPPPRRSAPGHHAAHTVGGRRPAPGPLARPPAKRTPITQGRRLGIPEPPPATNSSDEKASADPRPGRGTADVTSTPHSSTQPKAPRPRSAPLAQI